LDEAILGGRDLVVEAASKQSVSVKKKTQTSFPEAILFKSVADSQGMKWRLENQKPTST
jgi:hypothetical protein